LEFGDAGFCGRGKTGVSGETLGARREPTTNSTHTWHWVGIEPRPHWWEASALTTAGAIPALLNSKFIRVHFCGEIQDWIFKSKNGFAFLYLTD